MSSWIGVLRALLFGHLVAASSLLGINCSRSQPEEVAEFPAEGLDKEIFDIAVSNDKSRMPAAVDPLRMPPVDLLFGDGPTVSAYQELSPFNVTITADRLIHHLRSNNAHVRWLTTRRIAELAPEFPELVPHLAFCSLHDDDLWVQRGAVDALGWMERHAGSAVPVLVELLNSDDEELRWQSAFALAQACSHPEVSLPALRQSLQDEYMGVRNMASYAIGQFGSLAQDETEHLHRIALHDCNPMVRESARKALRNIRIASRNLKGKE